MIKIKEIQLPKNHKELETLLREWYFKGHENAKEQLNRKNQDIRIDFYGEYNQHILIKDGKPTEKENIKKKKIAKKKV